MTDSHCDQGHIIGGGWDWKMATALDINNTHIHRFYKCYSVLFLMSYFFNTWLVGGGANVVLIHSFQELDVHYRKLFLSLNTLMIN